MRAWEPGSHISTLHIHCKVARVSTVVLFHSCCDAAIMNIPGPGLELIL